MTRSSPVHRSALVFLLLLPLGAPDLEAQVVDRPGPSSPAPSAEQTPEPQAGEKAAGLRAREIAEALRPASTPRGLAPRGVGLDARVRVDDPDRFPGGPPALLQTRSRGAVPLMAAGGTLLLAGAIIGGDAGTIVMVGGAGVLAWGVYLYF